MQGDKRERDQSGIIVFFFKSGIHLLHGVFLFVFYRGTNKNAFDVHLYSGLEREA